MRRVGFGFGLAVFLVVLALVCGPATLRASETEKSEKAPAAEAEGHGGGEKKEKDGVITGGRFKGDNIYVHLQPLVLPVISENGAEQIVTLRIDLQAHDYDAAQAMHSNMPRVQDSVMRALYGGLGQGTLRNGHMIDMAKVKARVAEALERTLGTGKVDDVLVQAVAQRML